MKAIIQFIRDESGPTAVEYAVMLALIIGVCMIGIGIAGTSTADSFQDSYNKMDAAFNAGAGDADEQ